MLHFNPCHVSIIAFSHVIKITCVPIFIIYFDLLMQEIQGLERCLGCLECVQHFQRTQIQCQHTHQISRHHLSNSSTRVSNTLMALKHSTHVYKLTHKHKLIYILILFLNALRLKIHIYRSWLRNRWCSIFDILLSKLMVYLIKELILLELKFYICGIILHFPCLHFFSTQDQAK